MLLHASVIVDYAIEASGGDIGTVSDFLFDDASWLGRCLVVDTGSWLSGRKVLLPPSVFGPVYANDRVVAVKSIKQRIKDSPAYDPSMTIDRAYDEKLLTYYGIKIAAA